MPRVFLSCVRTSIFVPTAEQGEDGVRDLADSGVRHGRLFGTDGVRGLANVDLTADLFVLLGRALADSLGRDESARPRVVVGRDPRPSSDLLEAAFVAGVCSAGADVLQVGVMPTAGVAHLTTHLAASAGAVITASHNPLADNGLKLFDRAGHKYTDQAEIALETAVRAAETLRGPSGLDVGRIRAVTDSAGLYLAHVTKGVPSLRDLTVVVDSANGAAAGFAGEAYRLAGATVQEVAADRSGDHINCGVGATNPSFITAAVRERPGAIGLAHDGDADRLIAVDENGGQLDGADFLAIFGIESHHAGTLPADTVVTTPVTNSGLRTSLKRHGITVVESAIGDRSVLRLMLESGYSLGGEQNGHIIVLDRATTGDGILTAMRLMTIMATTGRTMAELAGLWTRKPQSMVNIAVPDRGFLRRFPELDHLVAAERGKLVDRGRLTVRISTIEPVVRVSCEAPDQEEVDAVTARIVSTIEQRIDDEKTAQANKGERLAVGS
jgi:phosphoglucosamine mutase